jgi:hypothetical protein
VVTLIGATYHLITGALCSWVTAYNLYVFVIHHQTARSKTLKNLSKGIATDDFSKFKANHFLFITAYILRIQAAMVWAKNASQNNIHQPQCASPYVKKKPVSTGSIILLPQAFHSPQTARTATQCRVPLPVSRLLL